MTAEQQQQFLDRSRQSEIMSELHGLRGVLEEVRSEARLTNGRLTRAEAELARQRSMIYGSDTDLGGDGGLVGMVREVLRWQKRVAWTIGGVVVPAALTLLAVYLPPLL